MGASNWIDVQRTPDRQLLWTDFSPEAMRALPSVPFSAVESFTGDDQLGAALTRQIVPMIDIPEPSTEALSEEAAPDPASGFNVSAAGDLGELAVETKSAGFTDSTENMSGLGLVELETGASSEVGARAFCAGGSTIWTVIGARKGQQRFNRWFVSCFRAGGRDTRDRDRC